MTVDESGSASVAAQKTITQALKGVLMEMACAGKCFDRGGDR